MEGLELISFQIISAVGTARSNFIEAIDEAKNGHFEEAKELIKNGQEVFVEGHKAHMGLIQKEAAGDKTEYSLLLMHAEDQLMSAEAFGILADKFVELYEKMYQMDKGKN